MGIINKFTKKCIFCKSKENTKYVEAFGIYGGVIAGNWYHDHCLQEVACNPENHSNKIVDMAIDIIDRIKTSKENHEKHIKKAKERCDYLHQHCI